jgi:hypothetical protein
MELQALHGSRFCAALYPYGLQIIVQLSFGFFKAIVLLSLGRELESMRHRCFANPKGKAVCAAKLVVVVVIGF